MSNKETSLCKTGSSSELMETARFGCPYPGLTGNGQSAASESSIWTNRPHRKFRLQGPHLKGEAISHLGLIHTTIKIEAVSKRAEKTWPGLCSVTPLTPKGLPQQCFPRTWLSSSVLLALCHLYSSGFFFFSGPPSIIILDISVHLLDPFTGKAVDQFIRNKY